MPKINVLQMTGIKDKEMPLPAAVFAVPLDQKLVKGVVVAKLANQRRPWAHTKVQWECRGGGRKPWRQKGTGRARHGSIRSPLWRGGGVTFGPLKVNNYHRKTNRQVKRKALAMALSQRLAEKDLIIIKNLELKEGRTREIATLMKKLKVSKGALIVLPKADQRVTRATANLPGVTVTTTLGLDAEIVLRFPKVIMTVAAITPLEKIFMKTKSN